MLKKEKLTFSHLADSGHLLLKVFRRPDQARKDLFMLKKTLDVTQAHIYTIIDSILEKSKA